MAKQPLVKTQEMFMVKLASAPNPDHYQTTPPANPKSYMVPSLMRAREVAMRYRDENDLGGGNWHRADVYDGQGKFVARISYNGRLWDAKGNEVNPQG